VKFWVVIWISFSYENKFGNEFYRYKPVPFVMLVLSALVTRTRHMLMVSIYCFLILPGKLSLIIMTKSLTRE
jgi:hypothetical protein